MWIQNYFCPVTDHFATSYRSCFVAIPVFTTSSAFTFSWSSCFWLLSRCASIENYFSHWALLSKTFQGICYCIQNYFCHCSSHLKRSPQAVSKLFLSLVTLLISVADHLAQSCYFVELFSRLIATLRIVLSTLLSNKLLEHGWKLLSWVIVLVSVAYH